MGRAADLLTTKATKHTKAASGPPEPVWYATDLNRAIGGRTTDLGELRVRPIIAGYGYVIGRTAMTADVLGGYALTSLSLTPAATDAYHQRLGARSVSGDAANAFVSKPEACGMTSPTRWVSMSASAT